jgi:predicted aspartyl protease
LNRLNISTIRFEKVEKAGVNYSRPENQNSRKCTFCAKPGHNEDKCYTKQKLIKLVREEIAQKPIEKQTYKKEYGQNNLYKKPFKSNKEEYKKKVHTNNIEKREITDIEDSEQESNQEESGSEDQRSQEETSDIDLGHLGINNITGDFLITKGYINGKEIEILIDSGAKKSVLPLAIVKKYDFPYKESKIKCLLGNGQSSGIEGVTKQLHVEVHNITCHLEFMILKRDNILLGVDWLNKTKAILDVSNQLVIFPRQEIFLGSLEEIDSVDISILTTEVECGSVEELMDEEYNHWSLEKVDRNGIEKSFEVG